MSPKSSECRDLDFGESLKIPKGKSLSILTINTITELILVLFNDTATHYRKWGV
jgi:hypothetical protein